MSSLKPMLAATWEKVPISFPVLVSPKLDGIRALIIDGVVMSRSFKPIPNRQVQECFGKPEFNGLDGELICGDPTHPEAYRKTVSGVMTHDGELDVDFHVFDDFTASGGFHERYGRVKNRVRDIDQYNRMPYVHHTHITSAEKLEEYEVKFLEMGYEGAMIRSLNGPYKYGRSTEREGYLLKLKRFHDSEAVILGFDEQMHNANPAGVNELGRTHRTSHKAGKLAKGTLGALKVRGIEGQYAGVEFDIGTGFDDAERLHIWSNQEDMVGKVVKVKYFPTGSKDKPRFPTFLGFRPEGA